ncbi:MAG: sensor histidine kinase [Sphaerochaeta sp.]|nr:sensor histidine kinase [Sphaerochaeta sp.]
MHVFICDFLLDIVQNSFEAESRRVELSLEETDTRLVCQVRDNGKGMDEAVKNRVLDPFYTDGIKHVKRKVGLGLPFLIQACEACNGDFSLESELGVGTTISFSFNLNHMDTPPFGDLPSTILVLMSHPLAEELLVKRSLATCKGSGEYELSKTELEDVLGPLNTSGTLNLLKEFLVSQEEDLKQFYIEHTLSKA